MSFCYSRTAVAIALSLAFQSSIAASVDDATVVVTATRVPLRTNEVLSDITVVDRQQIERAGNVTLPELLSSLAGVQFYAPGGRGSSGTLFIRGTNSNHALVLIDGQRVSSATVGTSAIEQLPIEQIERIEILRGPGSSLYGADALGGVIQVFTKRGAGDSAPSFFVGGGRYGHFASSAAYGGRTGNTAFHIQLGEERTSGFSDIKEAKGGLFDMYNADNDGYRNSNLTASLSHRLNSDLEVGVQHLQTKGIKHSDNANCDAFFATCSTAFDNRTSQKLASTSLFVDYRISPDWKSTVRFGQSTDDMQNWLFDPSTGIVTVDSYKTRQDQYSWQNEILVAGGKVFAAAEWRDVKVKSSKVFDKSAQDTNALILGYHKWFADHLVQVSARSDDISGLARQQTGTFAYGYRISDSLMIRTSVGTAFHAPTFNDLYWPLDPVNFFQGNPNLKPEKARNKEIAISYSASGTSADVTVYHNSIRDLINYEDGVAPTFIGTMGNIGSATLKGATFQFARSSGLWDSTATYDVLSARDDATGKALQRRASHSLNASIRRQVEHGDIGAQLKAVGSRFNNTANTKTVPGFTVVDIDMNYRFDKDWTAQTKIQNLFDKNYVLVRNSLNPFNEYSVAGRSLFIGVRYAPR